MQRNTFKIVFFCKKTKINKKGKAPIYVRITTDGVSTEIFTKGAGVRPDNDRSQRHDAKIHNSGSNPFRIPKIPTSELERLWLDPAIVSKEAAPLYSRYIPKKK